MPIALALADANAAMNICRLMVAAIYFWSGAQKLNPYFASGAFTYLAQPLAAHVPALAVKAGYTAPFIEMACAIGLATRKFRMPAIVMPIAMHAFILLAIGPFGHNFNTVVWPWNIAMIVFLLLLYRHSGARAGEILWGPTALHRIVFALFALAPALSFFNLWDSYLSAALYSGNKNQGAIDMSEAVAEHLPDEVGDDVSEEADNLDKVSTRCGGLPVSGISTTRTRNANLAATATGARSRSSEGNRNNLAPRTTFPAWLLLIRDEHQSAEN